MEELTSRERMLRTIRLQDTDHIPCCFMSFAVMRKRLNENWYEVAKAELSMGLDSMLFVPTAPRPARKDHPDLRGLPVRFSPEVKTNEWSVKGKDGSETLFKEYETPAGKLTTDIRISEDWPYGNHIPFMDDYQIPRARKFLVNGPEDFAAFDYMLTAPTPLDIAQYQQDVRTARAFTDENRILLTGGWGVGMDMASWLCGMPDLTVLMMEKPDFVDALLEKIHVWNKQRMDVVLSGNVDLYIRRGWYEGCDFVTPRFYKKSILPRLKVEVDLTHERGALFGYICSSGTKPMLDLYCEAGIDLLIGVDPVQGTYTDMQLMKSKLGERVSLWGGVSAAVTVERGTEAQVRAAVKDACKTLGPRGFILSPVDNITVDEPLTFENIAIFINEWKRQCGSK
jgi:uroporphyrinogen-III decarboxylase